MIRKLTFLVAVTLFATAHAQWTEPVRIGIPGAYLYPQILAAGDTLHVVGSHIPGGDKVVYLTSDDAGDSWGESHILSDTVNSTNAMFVRIVKNGQDIMVLWRSIFDTGPGPWNIGYALSDDNGETWTEPLYVLNPGWGHILYFSASGSGAVVNVILSSRIDHDLVFFNVRTTNFGQSWSEPEEIFSAAQSSLTDQAHFDNSIHYSWSGRFVWEGVWETYYLSSRDNGLSWSENTLLSEDDQEISQLPSICSDESGNVACTWWDFKYSPYQTTGDVLIRQSFDQGENWGREDQITTEHRASKSDVCWTGDSLYVVWEDWRFTLRTVYYVSSADSIHDWSNKQRLEDDPADSYDAVVAASEGNVYVIWADERCDPDTDICGGIYFTRLENEVAIEEDQDDVLPDGYSLEAYPNPFNSTTMITFSSPEADDTKLEILDLLGQRVRLFSIEGAKEGRIMWDATDALGNRVSSGIYFARAKTSRNYSAIKLLYLK